MAQFCLLCFKYCLLFVSCDLPCSCCHFYLFLQVYHRANLISTLTKFYKSCYDIVIPYNVACVWIYFQFDSQTRSIHWLIPQIHRYGGCNIMNRWCLLLASIWSHLCTGSMTVYLEHFRIANGYTCIIYELWLMIGYFDHFWYYF